LPHDCAARCNPKAAVLPVVDVLRPVLRVARLLPVLVLAP
jgi:hypothetical protein